MERMKRYRVTASVDQGARRVTVEVDARSRESAAWEAATKLEEAGTPLYRVVGRPEEITL